MVNFKRLYLSLVNDYESIRTIDDAKQLLRRINGNSLDPYSLLDTDGNSKTLETLKVQCRASLARIITPAYGAHQTGPMVLLENCAADTRDA